MKITTERIDALRHAARMVVRELGLHTDAYFDIGITLAERHLLIELESCLYPNVGDLAERLLLDKSTVSRLVAKAVKKEFVVYTMDKSDRRRRCLQLTEKGRQTLKAIEPLAQRQVKDALLTLNEEEAQTVEQGMALFAKGLGTARLRKEFTLASIEPQDNAALAHLITSVLKEHNCNKSRLCSSDVELQAMYEAYQQKGCAYFVIKKGAKVAGGAGIASLQNPKTDVCELRKICLAPNARGLGLDDLLIDACLREAKKQGYRFCIAFCIAMITEKNAEAEELYLRHGFIRKASQNDNRGHFDSAAIFEKIL